MKPSPRIIKIIFFGTVMVLTVVTLPVWYISRRGLSDPTTFDRTFIGLYSVAVALASGFVFLLTRIYVKSASRFSAATEALLRGDSSRAEAERSFPAELSGVVDSIDRISSEMRARINVLETERKALTTILGAMEEGLLVVDSQRKLITANLSARRILNLPHTDLQGIAFNSLIRQQDLQANIDRAISESQSCTFEFRRSGANEQILARCSSFRDGPGSLNGVVVVLHDITELRRLERMRTEFVANVSHELRTPLTSLMGYLETLQEGLCTDPEQVQNFLNVCRRQAERLSGIVEDLLRLSRLENPQQEMVTVGINLQEIVSLSIEQSRTRAEQRNVTLEADVPARAATILGDRGLLVQAVTNLVENAINYNCDNGRVKIKLSQYFVGTERNVGHWEIAVTDTGIGIPPDSLTRIFERFYRVDRARSREQGGTGLGLSIVKHIALAHGASVHVESVLGKGSTFRLRFPVSAN